MYFVLLILFSHSVFSQSGDFKATQREKNKPVPEGCMWFRDNLFMDCYEVSNAAYREYVEWEKSHKGKDSEDYRAALPDTLVWRVPLAYNEPYVDYYFRHPAYNHFPVIGITPGQAINYCEWRTHREKELMLTRIGLLPIGDAKKQNDTIWIDSVLTAMGINIKFRLPTEEEWEAAARAGNEHAIFPWEGTGMYDNKGNLRANIMIAGTGSMKPDEAVSEITGYCRSFSPNEAGLYCMAGNVSEMVFKTSLEKQVILKGGSWRQTGFHAMISSYDIYIRPDTYIGFRCVCEFSWH
ncbi:MAG: SUMF1/EgtB/PvdO family nonheme iron enzyme [Bacteroidota bacterium]